MKTKEINNKETKEETRGRKSVYNAKIHPLWAKSLAELHLIDTEIAKKMGISEQTINTWKNKYPEFKVALVSGKKTDNEIVENSLFKMAKGYDYDEVVERYIIDKEGNETLVGKTIMHKHLPASVPAVQFFLANRDKEHYSFKQDISLNNTDGEPFVINIK